MKIDLQSVLADAEELLTGLRDLDGSKSMRMHAGGHPGMSAARWPCASSC